MEISGSNSPRYQIQSFIFAIYQKLGVRWYFVFSKLDCLPVYSDSFSFGK